MKKKETFFLFHQTKSEAKRMAKSMAKREANQEEKKRWIFFLNSSTSSGMTWCLYTCPTSVEHPGDRLRVHPAIKLSARNYHRGQEKKVIKLKCSQIRKKCSPTPVKKTHTHTHFHQCKQDSSTSLCCYSTR